MHFLDVAIFLMATLTQGLVTMPTTTSCRVRARTGNVALEATRRAMVLAGSSAAFSRSLLAPPLVFAAGEAEPRDCNEAVYMILRVQEASQQEVRLVRSGKFKDLQRANVKFAVNLMLNNYDLLSNVNAASTLSAKSYEASQVGREAVEALQQILEYFDSAQKSLQVESLSGEKLEFVLKALQAVDGKCEQFLALLPRSEVDRARLVVTQENKLNQAEYEEANPGESYLNPPVKAA